MYQVLYRKWRPKTFSDVSGQEHITTTLLNELSTNRLNHAYLFTGSRGTGKTTCAKILAKAVNCLHPVNGNPCGECEICKGIDSGGILDVTEMDAASNRKIDDIRQIIDEVQFKPSKCKYRVYIIDEVHMLTTEAFNALLKTLEEPPEHAIFILATTEVHKLPQTILSRCQRFDFHRIPPRAIADRLLYVASQEGVTLSDGAALLAASVADGALRDALSLLDRCIAISSDIDEDVVRSAAGLARKTYLFELANCVINKNTAKALEIVNRLYGESKDMARLCDELLSHFRTLMLIKSVKNPRDIIIMADDEFEQAQVQSDYLSLADIVYYMDVLSRAYQNMGRGTGDRTELEMAVVKLSSAELDGTVEALTARVTALEKAVKKGIRVNCIPEQVQAVSQPVQSETPKPEVQKSEPEKVQEVKPVVETEKDEPAAPTTKIQGQPAQEQPVLTASAPKKALQRQSVDLDAIYNNAQPFPDWAEVVNNMKPVSRTIAAAFANSSAYTSGKYMLIDTDNEMAFELLKNNERRQEIRQLIFETTGQHYNLGPYKRPSAKQEDKTDPVDRLVESLQGSDVIITQK
ncbi:DNA polymerase III subunit gamma/tau [Ruminococcus bromii]|uniref:DNA polymerase III subunit gamma/tau n=1 Tax=Ruminococcus bromii TaxID=40518 RepID=UPI003A920AD2